MDRRGSDPMPEPSASQGPLKRENSLPGEKRRVCYAWERTGVCRQGSSCRFAHDEEFAYKPPDYTNRVWSNAQASTSEAPQHPEESVLEFLVMSYNVLADELAVAHAKELYRAVPDHCLPWSQRIIKLVNELLHWKPDIVCLQEIDHPADFTGPLGPLGYGWEYASRTGGRRDGCLTLWRQEKFECIAKDTVHMARFDLKDNVGLIVILRAKSQAGPASEQGPTLAVANTHLLFNPKRGDIKLGQAGLLLRRIAEICEDLKVAPLAMFMGDFNSTPQSGVYSFIASGELDCFLQDRRTLSGQLETDESWPPRSKALNGGPSAQGDAAQRRGTSLDDPVRTFRARQALLAATRAPQPHPTAAQHAEHQQAARQAAAAVAMLDQRVLGSIAHSSSFPTIRTAVAAGLKDIRHSGPVTLGQGPIYPYHDEFGQVIWSHIPPTDAHIERQPFYHQPMVVEEARPPPPPPPEEGLFRTVSFAKRQANAGTWSTEQLLIATGATAADVSKSGGGRRQVAAGAREWVAQHPLPMRSTYQVALGTEPRYTSCHGKFIGTVDYIWYTPEAKDVCLEPQSVVLPPPIESLHCGLPSPEWPSDHISLVARFLLRRRSQHHDDPVGAVAAAAQQPASAPKCADGMRQLRNGGKDDIVVHKHLRAHFTA